MTEPAAPAAAPAALAQRDALVVATEATVIPTLLALHGRQRQALEALWVCIAALGETAPAVLVAQEAELAAALAATETALRGYGFAQVDAGDGGDVAGRAGESSQGAIVNGGTFYGTVIGYQENQAGAITSWACHACKADNPPNTSFCFKCSTQLLQFCPECGQNTSMVISKICGSCGYHIDVAVKRSELRKNIASRNEMVNHFRMKTDRLMSINADKNAPGCISLLLLFSFCIAIGPGGDGAVKMVFLLMFLPTAAAIAMVSRGRKQKKIRLKDEISLKIYHIEQEIVHYQRMLNETNIR